MKYQLTLFLTGTLWSFFPGAIMLSNKGHAPNVYFDLLLLIVCAILTSLIIGNLFRNEIIKIKGWKFYILLPILILATALIINALITPLLLLTLGSYSDQKFELKVFLEPLYVYLLAGFTGLFPIFYPLTIGTNILVRKLNKS